MNRLLSILVSLFVLFLVYLWINHITTDPWSTDAPETFSIAEQKEVRSSGDPDVSDVSVSDPVTDPGTAENEADSRPEANPQEVPQAAQEESHQEVDEQPASTAQRTPQEQPEHQTTLKPEQQHLVIAGNFLERANAEKRVRELLSYGFDYAEVVNFQLSEYHTACAGRYENLDEAQRVARKLKSTHNIDAYVRHGN